MVMKRPAIRRGQLQVLGLLSAALLLSACAPKNPYVVAHGQFWEGNPAAAEETITESTAKVVEKDAIGKNLFLWDMGVYQFNQGKYAEAIETFKLSVADREKLEGTGGGILHVLSDPSNTKYKGDPVEITVAYMYIGASYYALGNYEMAAVALRRSLEEDFSKDETRTGDMAFVNMMLGEIQLKMKAYNDASVAYRRALAYTPDLIPALTGFYAAAKRSGDPALIEAATDSLTKSRGARFLEKVQAEDQGVVVIVLSDIPSYVTPDAWMGAFRNRKEYEYDIDSWGLRSGAQRDPAVLADHLHAHFKDQGGLKQEMKKEAVRQACNCLMQAAVVAGGGNAQGLDTKADLRHWQTMPGRIYAGYMPLEPGQHDIELAAYDANGMKLDRFTHDLAEVPVNPGERTLLVVTSYVKTPVPVLLPRIERGAPPVAADPEPVADPEPTSDDEDPDNE